MITRRTNRVVGCALRASAAFACALVAAHGWAADGADEQAAHERWRAANLLDYEYGYQKFCECHPDTPPETIVTVRAGEVVGVRHRPHGTDVEVPAPRNLEYYWTIDGLFALLQSARERGAEVRVQYHDTLGYPLTLYVNYDRELIGDELELNLTRVEPLR
jgi:hypothetical protein